MYMPKHFQESRSEPLQALIRAYPLATVVVNTAAGLTANHLPFELVDGALHGHVACGNELVHMDNAEVMVIFRGPDAYVSPNWYPTQHESKREVPTWNYAVVHVHGRLRVVNDVDWLRRLLETLTDRHEVDQSPPWKITDAAEDHVDTALRAIVGLDITIDRMEGKFKLSQNHPERNRAGVIAGLRDRHRNGDPELAALMAKQEPQT